MPILRLLVMASLFWISPKAAHSADETELWSALRSGSAFAIIRHALAPGTGDPSHFQLGDCTTQRNLSKGGRQQAAEIGDRFRRSGIRAAQVFSSEWCRCRDTAELMRLGPVRALPALNSFYERYDRKEKQTRALRAWLEQERPNGVLVLVTHQVNISALTGEYTSSGEMVVARQIEDGSIVVLGKL